MAESHLVDFAIELNGFIRLVLVRHKLQIVGTVFTRELWGSICDLLDFNLDFDAAVFSSEFERVRNKVQKYLLISLFIAERVFEELHMVLIDFDSRLYIFLLRQKLKGRKRVFHRVDQIKVRFVEFEG